MTNGNRGCRKLTGTNLNWQTLTLTSCSPVTMVTMGVSVEELQSLSSDGATLAMQQVMLGTHSEEEEDDDDEEEEEEGGIAGLG